MERTSTAIRVILDAVRGRMEPSHVIALVLEQACHLARAVHGSFIQVDTKSGLLIISSTYGPDWTEEKQSCHLKIGEGVTGTCAATGKPYLCANTEADPTYVALFDNVKSELVVPVIVRDETWGLINIDGFEANAFTDADLATLTLFAELVAFAFTLQEDFFERQRLHEEVMEGQKLSAIGKVIAGIAHEINNPLTSVLGQATLLSMTPDQPADPASIQTIVSESRRAARIIRTLLHFSRKETEGHRPVNVRDLVGEIFELREYQLRLNNIALRYEEAKPWSAIEANSDQIIQVLVNLVTNAEQAIDPRRRDGWISIRSERIGEKLHLSVEDNGGGIPEEAVKRIFEPFFSLRGAGAGSGLGLAVAHTLVSTHGGRLYLDSTGPGGTRFVMEFPKWLPAIPRAEAQPNAAEALVSAAPPAHQSRARILLVDDEPSIIQLLTRFFAMLHIDVDSAADGQEGFEKLRQGEFDMVLTDIKMPRLDGLELYHRAVAEFPQLRRRFLFMSGDVISESVRAFHEKTGCDVLEKPFDLGRLREMILGRLAEAEKEELAKV